MPATLTHKLADFNFQNVEFTPRFGTSNQEHIPGIESSQSTTSVGVTVTTSSPVTRQITNTNVDAAKVTITFPQLQKATDQGDLLRLFCPVKNTSSI